MDAYHFADKPPRSSTKIPLSRNNFSVNLHRELSEKPLQHSDFLLQNHLLGPLLFSLLNSLLAGNLPGDGRDQQRCQPDSCGVGETSSPTSRKAHNWRTFAVWLTVSRLLSTPNARPVCRKSPAVTRNIPVFGRLAPETGSIATG